MRLNFAHEKSAQCAPKMLISFRRPKCTYREASKKKLFCASRAVYLRVFGHYVHLNYMRIALHQPPTCVAFFDEVFFSYSVPESMCKFNRRSTNENKKLKLPKWNLMCFFGADRNIYWLTLQFINSNIYIWSVLQSTPLRYMYVDFKLTA